MIHLTLTFYIALSLMLRAFFDQRGPVLVGAFGIMSGGLRGSQMLRGLKLGCLSPVSMDKLALSLAQGQPVSPARGYALITAAAFSLLFTIAALRRFSEDEI